MDAAGRETIPLVDLAAQYRRHQGELDAAMRAAVESARFIDGPANARFEAAFARYCRVGYVVGVANGTDALMLILRGLGVGPGDEVVLPALTFVATAEAVVQAGARPVFVDVEPESAGIDPAAVAAAVGPRTRAVIPVHLYGRLAPIEAIEAIAAPREIPLVEDAAQAHGARRGDRLAGGFGLAAGFSFYPGKNLGAWGDAGAVATNDEALAAEVRRMANHGRVDHDTHGAHGVNSRLDALQAAVLEVKLRHLEPWTEARRERARRYDALLAGVPDVAPLAVGAPESHVHHLYVVRAARRDALLDHLRRQGIQAAVHYPTPLHLQPAYASLGHRRGEFPVAERLAADVLSLPLCPELAPARQERVAAAVRDFYAGGG
jgi:dTDP-4-amino-4,6-dideoxygalactose transaminase